MITANKGVTKIAGTNYDTIFEFNGIIGALQESEPEIVLGVISAWANVLNEKLEDADTIKLTTVTMMSEKFIKDLNKGDNDE